jgi:exodeoxyribonuclease VII large subunit
MAADFFEFRRQVIKARSTPARAAGGAAAGGEIPAGAAKAGVDTALTVSQLTEKIRQILVAGMPASLAVRGEVSNLNRNKASGHVYFTLKDAESCLDCVMFRSDAARLKFDPSDGMELLANGRIGVYPIRGRYQLYVSILRPLGQGALELAFQQVKAKLEAEGLFAPERKIPIPAYPTRIVIITSSEAAALQDVLKVLRRFSWMQIMIYATPVQGETAAAKIAAAIQHLNATVESSGAEVILLARGGGSLEDLWSFNEEIVARAIAASRIPIVTGIGHEVDVSIADLVADHHAHTPTEAAQVITARWRNAAEWLDGSSRRLLRGLKILANDGRQRLGMVERHEAFRRPTDRINLLRQRLDDRQRALAIAQNRLLRHAMDRIQAARRGLERNLPGKILRFSQVLADRRVRMDSALSRRLRLSHKHLNVLAASIQEIHPRLKVRIFREKLEVAQDRLARGLQHNQQSNAARLDALSRELEAVSPLAVLRRGYTITSRKKDGIALRSAQDLKPGDRIITVFADGQTQSIVEDSNQLSLFES